MVDPDSDRMKQLGVPPLAKKKKRGMNVGPWQDESA